jgi:hypothetical protein
MKLLKITQTAKDKLSRLILTMFNGNVNTVTAVQYGPYGEDSNPVKDTVGIYAQTEQVGKTVCLGVMNKNSKAEPGERRLYCTDENGVFKFNVWLKSDGTLLQGNSETPAEYTNFAVKYNELKADLDALKATVNANAAVFNTHTHMLTLSVGTGTAAPSVTQSQNNNTDFSNIKHEKIKYNG